MSAFRGRCKTPPVMAALAGLAAFAAPIDSGRDDLRRRVDRGQRHVSSCWMPSRQEKLKQSLLRVQKLESLIRHPKLSDRGRSKLESALRMQKVAVILGIRALAVCSAPPPRRAHTKRDMSNPGPDELLEQFDRGFVYSQIDISSN